MTDQPYTYEGCLYCGVKKGFSLRPDCESEGKIWGIEFAPNIKLGNHYWTTIMAVPKYGRSIVEEDIL